MLTETREVPATDLSKEKIAESTEKDVKRTPVPYEDVLAASTEYFEGDELAASVWVNKYALKDSDGNIYERTPDDMHRRLAKEIARVEAKYPNSKSE
jgi:ribonucleoside-diphosphate reductase alpha chain